MCGIAGVVILDPSQGELRREMLAAMLPLLQHRGPDDAGEHRDGPCCLLHSRLSIIDLTRAGHQPMSNEDGTVWLSYNGEIYNHRDLRRDCRLDDKGHRFRSRTDGEVILHLYEEMPAEFVPRLDGMFAFALWDAKARTLLLARDRFGIKPLFYTFAGGAFWFASEIKALLRIPGLRASPSLEALHHYLAFNYVPGPLTAFEGIHELRPGCTLTIQPGAVEPTITCYWQWRPASDPQITEVDAIRRSRELLSQAVERQLVSDVPVGVMLSGGMDSSALAALMAKIRGDAGFHTFAIGFDDPSFDESSYARLVAEHLGTSHHEIRVTAKDVAALLPGYLSYIDEPYADGSAIPTYLLAREAADFVTVLLSGEGGDECFGGYDTYTACKVRRWYRHVPRVIRRGVIRPLVNLLPVSHRKLSFEFKARRFADGAELDVPSSHFCWRMVLSEDAKRRVLRDPDRFATFPESQQLFVDAYNRCEGSEDLARLMAVDCTYHLPDDLMVKNDRMTMAWSLEARVPFTDLALVEFLSSVPAHLRIRGLRKKHLLREAMTDLLPPVILRKKKVGLEMPYSRWFRNELRDLGTSILSAARVSETGLFNPDGVKLLWDEHQAMRADHGRALWGLVNYLGWYDLYLADKDFASHLRPVRAARTV